MPVRCPRGKPRYRVKTFASGKRVRLTFCGKKKVVETKKLKTKNRSGFNLFSGNYKDGKGFVARRPKVL